MARLATLAQLRTRALQRSDHENDNYIPQAEANDMINQSLTGLYDMLVAASEDYFVSPTPYTFSIVANQSAYAVPADFYKIRGLDLQLLANGTGSWITLRRYNWNERNRYNYQPIPWNSLGVSQVRYHLTGSTLTFIPLPTTQTGNVRLWYVPACPLLVADGDTYDGVNGWDEWVVADVARKIKTKEESDTSVIDATLGMLTARVLKMCANRDVDRPPRTVDVSEDGTWNSMGFPGDMD